MCISIRTCTFRERERSSQRDILCQPILVCDWSPSQAKNNVTAHLGLAYIITTFLHPQDIILYQDSVASGSVVHHSPNTSSDMVLIMPCEATHCPQQCTLS